MAYNWTAKSIKAADTLREAADQLDEFNKRHLANKRRKQNLTITIDDNMQREEEDVAEIKFDESRRDLTAEEKAFEDEFGYGGTIFETSSSFVRDRYEELRYKAWASIPREGQTYVDFAGYTLGEPIGQYRRHCPVSRRDGISEDFRGEPQSMETESTDQTTEDGNEANRSIRGDIGMVNIGRPEYEPESVIDSIDKGIREKGMGEPKDPPDEGTSNDADGVDAAQGGDREADVFLSRGRTSCPTMKAMQENRENASKERIMRQAGIGIDYFDEELKGAAFIKRELKYLNARVIQKLNNLTEYANSTLENVQVQCREPKDSTDGRSFKSILMGTLCGTTASELPGTKESEEMSICDTMPVLLAAVTAVKRENDLSRWKGIVEHGWSNIGEDQLEQKKNIEYYIHPDGLGMRKFRDQIWMMTGTCKYGFKASLRQTLYAIRDRLVEKGFDIKLVRMALQKRDFSHFDMEHIICRMRDHSDF